jgi:uncharacterized RDD family membrane protein YckC
VESARELLDTSVAIETPEHVVFRYRIAGPARRMLAHLLDLLLCWGAFAIVVFFAMLFIAGATTEDIEDSPGKLGMGVVLLALFATQWVYFVAWEATRGRTPGKAAAGLRVVTTSGRPIGFSEAALRNVLRAADVLPIGYAVGLVSMALSRRFQRLGDLVAGTMVIVQDRPNAARILRLFPPATQGELADLPADVQLDVEERTAIEMFLRRRGTLGAARERELAEMIAAPLAARFEYRHDNAARMLALFYDRAANAGRGEGPMSSRRSSWLPGGSPSSSGGPRFPPGGRP